MAAIHRDDWAELAKCRGTQDAMFPEGAGQKRASELCGGCPVLTDCLAEALDNRIEWGVWGGMTERARRRLLNQRPDVESWSALLRGRETSSAKR